MAVRLPESIEHVRKEVGIDALPAVMHFDSYVRLLLRQTNTDSPARRSELDRVPQQIPEHLLQPAAIAHHGNGRPRVDEADRDVLRVRFRPNHVERGIDDR